LATSPIKLTSCACASMRGDVVGDAEGPADEFASACIEVAIVTPLKQEDNASLWFLLLSLFGVWQRRCSRPGRFPDM